MNALLERCPDDGCLWLAANVLLQATLAILIAWALARTAARRRAAARHAIWLCALAVVLLSPVTAILMDRAGVELLRLPVGPRPAAAREVATTNAPVPWPAGEPRLVRIAPSHVSAPAMAPDREGSAAERSSSTVSAAPFTTVCWWRATAAVGLAIWALGSLWLLARLAWRGLALRRLLRATCPAEDRRLQDALEAIRKLLGARTPARVAVWRGAGARITPVAVGVLRPTIVVSTDLLDSLSEGELRDVLIHEWAHVLRRDAAVGLMQRAAEIGFWFHPLVRLMNGELARAREEVCDNYVLRFTDGARYAQTLFDLAQKVVPLSPRWAQLGLLQPCWRLEDRVAGLLDPRRNTMTRLNRCASLAMALGFFAIAALTAGAKITQAEPQAGPAATGSAEQLAGKPRPSPQPPNREAAVSGKPSQPAAAGLTYTGRVTEKGTGKPIAGATVTVRREIFAPYERKVLEEPKYQTDAEGKYTFTIPPEQAAQRFLYIQLDVTHPDYAGKCGFGYALSMIRKNEPLGQRPFFEHVELLPAEPIWGAVALPDGKPAAGIKVLGFSKRVRRDYESGSFVEDKTNDRGEFRLNMAKGGDGVFWLLPKDVAPATHVVLKKRGDLGKFTLEKGVAVKGRVLDQHGKPLAAVWVNAMVCGGPAKKTYDIPVAEMLSRAALTDAKGEFALAPLPASEYVVKVEQYPRDSLLTDRTPRVPPAAFAPLALTLKEGEMTRQVELRAMPEVVIEGQFYDSKGKPRLGHQPGLWGRMPGKEPSSPTGSYHVYGQMDANGKFVFRAPKGLERAGLDFSTNEHSALRVRMKKGGPLSNQTRYIDLGVLDHDIRGIEVVRYEAPILLVKPLAEDGSPVKDAEMVIAYPKGDGQSHEGYSVSYKRQPDGRLRTTQLLPDEPFWVTVSAAGYEPRTEKLQLPEAAVRELAVRLRKGQDSEKGKPPDPPKR